MAIEVALGIRVSGAARLEVAPDVARVRLGVEGLHPSPRAALAAVGSALAAVRAVVARHGIGDAGLSSSRLDLESIYEGYAAGRSLVGYQCRASLQVTTTGLDEIGILLIDAVDAGATEIGGVEFGVQEPAPLLAQVRAAAMADARTRAETYAAAAGVVLGQVVSVEDFDTGPVPVARSKGLMAMADVAGVVPGAVEVGAGVSVGFALG